MLEGTSHTRRLGRTLGEREDARGRILGDMGGWKQGWIVLVTDFEDCDDETSDKIES
jgi:hypothetical protein